MKVTSLIHVLTKNVKGITEADVTRSCISCVEDTLLVQYV